MATTKVRAKRPKASSSRGTGTKKVRSRESKEKVVEADVSNSLKRAYQVQVVKNKAYEERIEALKADLVAKEEKMKGMVEMTLQLQPYIPHPPVQNKEILYQRACSNDTITVQSWYSQWLSQIKENKASYDFKDLHVMAEFGKNSYKPCVIAGSGPSLKKNAHLLADPKKRGDVCLVSCLHNFAFFTDKGIKADYYVNLDAGKITEEELSQGGEKDEEYYWEKTKDATLVTVIHAWPPLLKRWKGRIVFFNVVVADQQYADEVKKIVDFNEVFNVGGNTLGAALYMARAILGSSMIAYVGADFCFSYNRKFHPFDSPYDQKFAGVVPWTDIFGNRVYTWQSYLNFKYWFDYIAIGGKGGHPGLFVNCSEGGILGSYAEGNIQFILQWTLDEFLHSVNMHKVLPSLLDKHGYSLLF